MDVAFPIHGFVMVVEIVLMESMNHRTVDHQIEHVQQAYGNVTMVVASVSINDAMESMIAGRENQRRNTFSIVVGIVNIEHRHRFRDGSDEDERHNCGMSSKITEYFY